jgi:hypothetical protein
MEKNRYMLLNYTFFDKCREYKNGGYLLFNLVWEAKYSDTKTLETGCIDLNKSELAREINLSTATIDKYLSELKNKKELEIDKNLVRVINYKEYIHSKDSKKRGEYKLINQTFVDEIRKDKKYFTLWMYLIRFAIDGCVKGCYTESIAKAIGCAKDKFIKKRKELEKQGLIYKKGEEDRYSLKIIHYNTYTTVPEKENKESANFALEQQKNATLTDKKSNGDLIKNATQIDKKGNPFIINNNKENITSFINNTRTANLEEETLSLNTNQSGSVKEKEKPAKEKEKPAENTTSGYTNSGVYQTNAHRLTPEDVKYKPTPEEINYREYVRSTINSYVPSKQFEEFVSDFNDVDGRKILRWAKEFFESETKCNKDHLLDIKGDGSLFQRKLIKHLNNYIKVCYNKYKKSIAGHNVI